MYSTYLQVTEVLFECQAVIGLIAQHIRTTSMCSDPSAGWNDPSLANHAIIIVSLHLGNKITDLPRGQNDDPSLGRILFSCVSNVIRLSPGSLKGVLSLRNALHELATSPHSLLQEQQRYMDTVM